MCVCVCSKALLFLSFSQKLWGILEEKHTPPELGDEQVWRVLNVIAAILCMCAGIHLCMPDVSCLCVCMYVCVHVCVCLCVRRGHFDIIKLYSYSSFT